MTKSAIIFDTDIGTDIDDVLALMLLINITTRELSVVTTNGPTRVRAKIALTLLKHLNRRDISVFEGKSISLSETAPFVHGKENQLVNTKLLPRPLSNLCTWCLKHAENSITIISTGPLTTVAWLLDQKGIKTRIKNIIWMGGSIPANNIPSREHNLHADQISAQTVLHSNIPLFIIPINATIKHCLSNSEIEIFKHSKSALGRFVWQGMKIWLKTTILFKGKDQVFSNRIFLHDPVTVFAGLNTKMIRWTRTSIDITNNGRMRIPGENSVNICAHISKAVVKKIKELLISSIQQC